MVEAGPSAGERPRLVDVGWLLDSSSAQLIWEAPRRVVRQRPERRHPKSLTQCPAIVDMDARLFEVRCPIDAALGFRFEGERPVVVNLAGDQSPVRSKHLNQLLAIVSRAEWADPQRPVIQIITPYVFVADEPVFVNQLPPFYHWRKDPLPGLVIGGRFPVHLWPRQLMWAFEWHDITKPLVLRRGEPWWYVRFDHADPSRGIRLVEATLTEELADYMKGLSGVSNYVNQTFQLFETARERRPERLLMPRARQAARAAGPLDPAMETVLEAEARLVHGPGEALEPRAAHGDPDAR